MKAVAEFIVRTVDLLEAEGRSARSALREEGRVLRRATKRFSLGLVFLGAACTLVLVGLVLCLTALYLWLRQSMGEPGALLVMGLLLMSGGGLCAWIFNKSTTTS